MTYFISPHPPIVVNGIGGGREREAQATINGMKRIASEVAALKPKVIAVVTPHGNVFSDAMCVSIEENLSGSFKAFGYPEIKLSFSGSPLSAEIAEALSDASIPCEAMDKTNARRYGVRMEIDHGALVPLWFIQNEYDAF